MNSQPTPEQMLDARIRKLEQAVKNLLVDNINFKDQVEPNGDLRPAHYPALYPMTRQYIEGPLQRKAELILEEIEQVRELCVEMLAERNAENENDPNPGPAI